MENKQYCIKSKKLILFGFGYKKVDCENESKCEQTWPVSHLPDNGLSPTDERAPPFEARAAQPSGELFSLVSRKTLFQGIVVESRENQSRGKANESEYIVENKCKLRTLFEYEVKISKRYVWTFRIFLLENCTSIILSIFHEKMSHHFLSTSWPLGE